MARSNQREVDRHRAVVVGGGLAGLESALYLKARLGDQVAVTLISDQPRFVYRPFLTYVTFGLDPDHIHLDLKMIADQQDFRLLLGRVDHVDPARRLVQFGSQSVAYDSLILATGAAAVEEAIPGLRRGYTVWSEKEMLALRDRLGSAVESPPDSVLTRVVFLVPPGALWTGPIYELALMTATWLTWVGARDSFDLHILTPELRHVEALGEKVHDQLAESLIVRGIRATLGARATAVKRDTVRLGDGEEVPFDLLINAAVYHGAGLKNDLPVDEKGFYRTRTNTRQIVSDDQIYAVGDGSDYPVKQGFLALLQADAAGEHIASRLLREEPAFDFTTSLFWLMEEFDEVLFAHGDPEALSPDVEVERLPIGRLRRLEAMGYLPRQQRLGNPLYSGLLWKGTEIGLTLVKQLQNGR